MRLALEPSKPGPASSRLSPGSLPSDILSREKLEADMNNETWPELQWSAWSQTAATLHMWTQIVGKTRLALTPLQNHWWNVPLYVTAHGLSTSAMAYGDDVLDIEFDFLNHELRMRLGSGKNESLALKPKSVAEFYREYLQCLHSLGADVKIWPMPVEIQNPIRFDLDTEHKSYDPEYAHRFWQVLAQAEKVFRAWAPGFMGKVSPVHFFWGSFDLAVTRFSGRPAPPRDGAARSNAKPTPTRLSPPASGPAMEDYGEAAFYCYAAPCPTGCPKKISLPQPSGTKTWESTSSNMTTCAASQWPDEALLKFIGVPTQPQQTQRNGTGSCWIERPYNWLGVYRTIHRKPLKLQRAKTCHPTNDAIQLRFD